MKKKPAAPIKAVKRAAKAKAPPAGKGKAVIMAKAPIKVRPKIKAKAKPKLEVAEVKPPTLKPLSPRELIFVNAYLVDKNGTKAALAAGYSPKTAPQLGSRLLKNVHVRAAVDAGIAAQVKSFEIKAEDVLRRLSDVAFGDANQLIEYRRSCCRFCHGIGNRYQLTPGEMEAARIAHDKRCDDFDAGKIKRDPGEFDERGGDGYDGRLPPHADCPECWGEGVGRTFIHDTRSLSPEARAMYAGVEETKDGLKVRIKSADKAIEQLAKHKQLYVERLKVEHDFVDEDELDALYEKGMQRAAAKRAIVAERAKEMGLTPSGAPPEHG